MEESVIILLEPLEVRTSESTPLDWAVTQNNLGNALRALSEHEGGTTHLEEAVTIYRETLERLTRESVTHYWSVIEHNLNIALQRLHERQSESLPTVDVD